MILFNWQLSLSQKKKKQPSSLSLCLFDKEPAVSLCKQFPGLRFKNKIELACKCSCPFKDRAVTQTSIREVSRAHEGPFSSL